MSDAADAVLLERGDAVVRIRFNRPAVLNALDEAMAVGFLAACRRVAADPTVRVIVLAGAGRAFMAGGDIGRFRAAGADAPRFIPRIMGPLHEAIEILAEWPRPVLASLHGAVAGGGMSLALTTDLAIAADDARFSLAYARIGTSPDGSSSFTLPRMVGLRKALEIALLSETIDAAEALRLGLVNRVVPAAALVEETDRLARRLAEGPAVAYGGIKRLMRASFDRTLPEQLAAEAEAFAECAGTRDFAEGVNAFLEKREPRFRGE